MKARRRKPEVVLRNGRPAAIILDINDYAELLERAEDPADRKTLRAVRRRPLSFSRLEDLLDQRRMRQISI
jgi:PHD/YefM family antitoxin component YafN of YafNO toxin-antitoxin module